MFKLKTNPNQDWPLNQKSNWNVDFENRDTSKRERRNLRKISTLWCQFKLLLDSGAPMITAASHPQPLWLLCLVFQILNSAVTLSLVFSVWPVKLQNKDTRNSDATVCASVNNLGLSPIFDLNWLQGMIQDYQNILIWYKICYESVH